MRTILAIGDVRKEVARLRSQGKLIGFVPTMGAFHEGHLSLMRAARRETSTVVVSIFVNPLQFGPGEDYERYPRQPERDSALAEQEGVDILFTPPAEEMYPDENLTTVEVTRLGDVLCGKSRPGHFRGVATVVTKLFNIVEPDVTYFGQKDAQQAVIIKRMVRDLNMNVEIRVLPTVREPDGLAMSSRNQYLGPEERKRATIIYRALEEARGMVETGERSAARLRRAVGNRIAGEKLAKVEYVAVVHPETLEPLEKIEGPALIAVAVRIGACRLIDNSMVNASR